MMKMLTILWNSFKMAIGELKANKLRTFLSLFGITIGIFCIIGVLATIDSLQSKIKSDLSSFGNNSVYIDKWDYSGGPEYPWWKFVKRPSMKIEEMDFVKKKSTLASNMAFVMQTQESFSYEDNILKGVNMYGITPEYKKIQSFNIGYGRFLSESDFTRGVPYVVIGYKVAEELYGKADKGVGKTITYNGRKLLVIGVIEKQGSAIINGYDYDKSTIVTHNYMASVYNPDNLGPVIMVQPKSGITSKALQEELTGIMRQIRKLSPTQDDNFTCNDVAQFKDQVESVFGAVNQGGWAIAGLSLIVGAFGVANIMFVTVRERTSQIGLKKAIGAKSSSILYEFLLESAFLCIIGGLVGLLLVWLLTLALSTVLPFAITIAPSIILLAFSICIILGVVSGIIPASIAAKMNPVEAIRTK
ncbi:MAG: ABC transporter permease [Sediminibacterium sp.]|jgi:putative ABC transport system permease protein|nr:ABC transporter permease [Sediminibacterium sp.]